MGSFTKKLVSFFERREKAGSSKGSAFSPRTGQLGSFVTGSYEALCVATVYRCVTLLCTNIAALPLRYLVRGRDGVYSEDVKSRLHYLLTVQPNQDYSAFDFWSHAVFQILMYGNAYIYPRWSRMDVGEIDEFVLLTRGTVSYDSVNATYTVLDSENGVKGVFAENEIIHLKNLSLDGKHGLSVIGFARQTLDIASTGDKETFNRFAYGGNVRGIVSNDTSVRGFGEYQDSELQKTAENLDYRFQSGEKIVSLPGQAQFNQLSLSSVDMEFLNTRKFTVRDICRFFGVPPTFVFDDTSLNYKSAEMANVAFLSQTLNPILIKIENELHRKLIAPSRCCKYRFQFDRRSLYASDLSSRADYQNKTISSGIYTINDWRKYENLPEVEGGDEPLVSANLKSLGSLLAESPASEGQGAEAPEAENKPIEPEIEDDEKGQDKDTEA